jgi:hypothetical protein
MLQRRTLSAHNANMNELMYWSRDPHTQKDRYNLPKKPCNPRKGAYNPVKETPFDEAYYLLRSPPARSMLCDAGDAEKENCNNCNTSSGICGSLLRL